MHAIGTFSDLLEIRKVIFTFERSFASVVYYLVREVLLFLKLWVLVRGKNIYYYYYYFKF